MSFSSPRGGRQPLAREARERRRPPRRSATSCRCAPRPQIAPSWTSPDHGSWRQSAASASTVSTWERKPSDGPLGLAAQARDEVRPLRVAAVEQLALEARVLQVARQPLLARALVAGRVDRVEADQPRSRTSAVLGLQVHGCRATVTAIVDTLFDAGGAAAPRRGPPEDGPLAARMRPRTLDEFVGQEHLLGEGSALRTAIEQGRPHSMILYGPPGTGKTTLARMTARARRRGAFEELSAVEAGRAEVREVIARAAERRRGRAGDDLLPRRDPPLQQGPAGRAAAGGRGRDSSR